MPESSASASAAPAAPTKKQIEIDVAKLPLDVFIRPAGATPRNKANDEELIPGLKGFLGTLVSRRKTEKKPEPEFIPESASVAARIARDFGLLGTTEP